MRKSTALEVEANFPNVEAGPAVPRDVVSAVAQLPAGAGDSSDFPILFTIIHDRTCKGNLVGCSLGF